MNKKIIILLSGLISVGIYMFLPADKNVLKGLAILFFIAALWITEALPITVTALLVPIVAVMTKIFDVREALSYFAHPIIFLFLGGVALAAALHKYNLDELFAGYIMKTAGSKMIFSVIGLFIATALISMWISNPKGPFFTTPYKHGIINNGGVNLLLNCFIKLRHTALYSIVLRSNHDTNHDTNKSRDN